MKTAHEIMDEIIERHMGPVSKTATPPRKPRWTDEDWLLIPRIPLDPPKKPEIFFAGEDNDPATDRN